MTILFNVKLLSSFINVKKEYWFCPFIVLPLPSITRFLILLPTVIVSVMLYMSFPSRVTVVSVLAEVSVKVLYKSW